MIKVNIELNESYKEHLDLLKQIVPNKEGKQVVSDSEMVEVLIDEFVSFIEQHAAQEQAAGHSHDHGEWCGCSH